MLLTEENAFQIGLRGNSYPNDEIESLRNTSLDWQEKSLRCFKMWDLGRRWRETGKIPRQIEIVQNNVITFYVESPFAIEQQLKKFIEINPSKVIRLVLIGEKEAKIGFVPTRT